jgi:hypothetical protein
MKKLLLGIIISVFFVVFILLKFDFKAEFEKLSGNISYEYLIPIFLTQVMGLVVFSYRWRSLLERKINLKHAISSSFIGYAANMVLPARGGDLFRVYYSRNETEVAYFNLLSKLFIEKVLDFIFVVISGSLAFFIINYTNPTGQNFTLFFVSGLILVGMFFSLYLLRFQNELLQKILHKVFIKLKKEEFYKGHIQKHVIDLETFLHFNKLFRLLVLTFGSWIFYLSNYYFVSKMLGVELNTLELVFILFCGAMSLAVPSAPSGIGVFHAAIFSGFLLLGKNSSQGILYATALHLLSFVIVTFLGLLFYIYWTYRRRHGFKKDKLPTGT